MVFLVAVEWITLKWNTAETMLKGKSVPVISNGQLMIDNLKTLRISVDDLEKRLRLAGISRTEDVKTATIEDNGELGYELMPHAKPVTMGELEKLLRTYLPQAPQTVPQESQPTIFKEVLLNKHSDHVPKELQ